MFVVIGEFAIPQQTDAAEGIAYPELAAGFGEEARHGGAWQAIAHCHTKARPVIAEKPDVSPNPQYAVGRLRERADTSRGSVPRAEYRMLQRQQFEAVEGGAPGKTDSRALMSVGNSYNRPPKQDEGAERSSAPPRQSPMWVRSNDLTPGRSGCRQKRQ